MNNLIQFGQMERLLSQAALSELSETLGSGDAGEDVSRDVLSPLLSSAQSSSDARSSDGQVELIAGDLFYSLSLDSIETATTVLRDQMLEAIRLNSVEIP